jgi:hypothetical protein
MTRYDLLSPRKSKDDKTRWHKIGAAFPRDKGGFSLVFDSLPLPDADGRVSLMMWEAKPRDEGQGSSAGGYQQPLGAEYQGDIDSDIPF